MMNVHWVLVPSGGNYSDQWPISLLITSQFQLPKFSFLNGSMYLRNLRYNGVGGVVNNGHVAITIEVVGTCVIAGDVLKG